MRSILRFATLIFICLSVLVSGVSISDAKDGVARATLANGLRVVIVPNRLAPVATTMVNYLAGSNETPPGFPGTAHALEHMMYRGSPGLSSSQLATLIGAMGGSFNANTQQTLTQYYFTVPTDDLEIALRAESLRMQGVLSTEELWEQERGAIEQEIAQDLSNPMYLFYQKLIQNVFDGTPYAVDALGTRSSFEMTTGKDLKDFHDKWYAPNNAILVVTGDVDPEKTLALVKELFEGIPPRPVDQRPAVQLQPLKADLIEMETDLPYGLAIVAYRLPGYCSPDFAPAQVMVDVLASERGDLYALVPEGKALAAGFVADFLPEAGLGYAYAAFPIEEEGRRLVSLIKEILSGVSKTGTPSDLCEAAKRAEAAEAEYEKDSIEGLASLWSQALALEGRESPEEGIQAIQKVRVADVDRVLRKYLVNETAVVGVLKPHPSGSATESHVFHSGESFAPKEAKPVQLPEWAEKAIAPTSIPVSNLSPSMSTLPNGMRVIFMRQTVSPTVSLYGEVKHQADLQSPEGKEGVAEVLEALLPYGAAGMDRIEFRKAIDDIAADLITGARFSLRVLSEHFERGVELLAANLLEPALPEAAFEIVKQETLASVAGQLQSPGYLTRVELLKALYPKEDPALRQPSPESVASITLEDVKGYYRSVFRPDQTVLVVIGNISEEEAKRVVQIHFGHWEATGPKPETDLPPVPLSKASQKVVPDASGVQDEVSLVETLGLTRSHPDYYPLEVGNHVLSGAFYATRLYRDLREKTGLVYSVSSDIHAGKTRSSFEVSYACDPQKVSEARRLVEQNLQDMRERPVSPSELRQAKTLLLKEIPLSESSVSSIGQKLLLLALMGLPLDEPVRAAKRYQEVTAEQVQQAFYRWLRPEDLAQVVRGSHPQ
jgi:zinc protease